MRQRTRPVPALRHRLPGHALTLLLLLGMASGSFGAAPLLLRDVQPLDAVSGLLPRQDVLLRDGRIAAMGRAIAPPADATLIEAGGRYLIPGLWDMHVHLSYDPRLTDAMPGLFLDYGVTSIRDTGGLLEIVQPIVRALRDSAEPAPRVFFAGPLLDGQPVVYDGAHGPHIGIANASPEQARQSVARLAAAGVDFIKIYEMVTPAVFDALVEAAVEHGLPIAAHVPLSMLASTVGPQVQSLEHLRNIEMDCAADADALLLERRAHLAQPADDGAALRSALHAQQRDRAIDAEDTARCAQVIAALRDTIQVPTARLNAMTQHPPFLSDGWSTALAALPAAVADDWATAPQFMDPTAYRVSGEWTLRMIPRLRDAGVPIGAGTDTPIGWAVPGFSLHRELEILVAAGLTPREALAAATRVPARFFGLEQQMGAIAVGQVADLVLLEGNPLDNISNTRRIAAVIAAGRLVRGGGRSAEVAQRED